MTNVTSVIESDTTLSSATIQEIEGVGMLLGDSVKTALFILVLLGNLVLFVYWGLKMLFEIRDMLISKIPKIYVCLFLCNDYERFRE